MIIRAQDLCARAKWTAPPSPAASAAAASGQQHDCGGGKPNAANLDAAGGSNWPHAGPRRLRVASSHSRILIISFGQPGPDHSPSPEPERAVRAFRRTFAKARCVIGECRSAAGQSRSALLTDRLDDPYLSGATASGRRFPSPHVPQGGDGGLAEEVQSRSLDVR